MTNDMTRTIDLLGRRVNENNEKRTALDRARSESTVDPLGVAERYFFGVDEEPYFIIGISKHQIGDIRLWDLLYFKATSNTNFCIYDTSNELVMEVRLNKEFDARKFVDVIMVVQQAVNTKRELKDRMGPSESTSFETAERNLFVDYSPSFNL